ncbi:hypothetical protein ASG94_13035 [Nocardioides sp. Soil805]|nr:hypothetical protein ASG94_13035 [Nocardioides sp. Soil805]
MVAIGRFVSLFFSLATVPVVARALGPDGRGVSATMLAVITFSQVMLGLGVPLAVRRRAVVMDDLTGVMNSARLFAALTIVPALVMGFLVDLSFFGSETTSSRIAFFIGMAAVPLAVSWATDVSVLVAREQYLRMAVLGLIQAATSLVCVVSFWLAGGLDVASVLYANLAGSVLTFVVGLAWVRVPLRRHHEFASLLREGASLTGGQLASVASGRLDQVLVLGALGSTSAGLYSVAVTIGTLPLPIAQAVGAGAYPKFANGDREATTSAMRHCAALGIVAALLLAMVSPFLIPILFGHEFAGAVGATLVSVLASVSVGIAFVTSMALAGARMGNRMTAAQTVGLAVGLALLTPLAMLWGVVGAAVAMLLGTVTTTTISLHFLRLNPFSIFPRPVDWAGAIRFLVR